MRTNIDIDDDLMEKAMKASDLAVKTKKAVVEDALERMVRAQARQALFDLAGEVEFWEEGDTQAMTSDVRGGSSKAKKLHGSPRRKAA